jgi:Ca2+-binding RTX toxin-like protein
MTHKYKIITTIAAVALLSTGLLTYTITTKNPFVKNILSSMGYGDKVIVNAQTAGVHILTVAVEQYTPNHLPNITGTCTIGDTLDFTIKKGNTGVVSETFSKLCDVSPYTSNPTITLPDGKYSVNVKVAIACVAATVTAPIVNGTAGNNTLRGTAGNDTIYGNGGNDRIFGGAGNDSLYASSPTTSLPGNVNLTGDGGCDLLVGGNGGGQFNGTNDTLLGIGEQDVLIGGTGVGGNVFTLGNPSSSYYYGNGDSDYAEIRNFRCPTDVIRLEATFVSNFSLSYVGSTANIFRVNSNGSQDLIAKIINAPANLSLSGGPCFTFGLV